MFKKNINLLEKKNPKLRGELLLVPYHIKENKSRGARITLICQSSQTEETQCNRNENFLFP